jgi:hypothetical protein
MTRGLESLLLTVLALVLAFWILPDLYRSVSNPYRLMGEALSSAVDGRAR